MLKYTTYINKFSEIPMFKGQQPLTKEQFNAAVKYYVKNNASMKGFTNGRKLSAVVSSIAADKMLKDSGKPTIKKFWKSPEAKKLTYDDNKLVGLAKKANVGLIKHGITTGLAKGITTAKPAAAIAGAFKEKGSPIQRYRKAYKKVNQNLEDIKKVQGTGAKITDKALEFGSGLGETISGAGVLGGGARAFAGYGAAKSLVDSFDDKKEYWKRAVPNAAKTATKDYFLGKVFSPKIIPKGAKNAISDTAKKATEKIFSKTLPRRILKKFGKQTLKFTKPAAVGKIVDPIADLTKAALINDKEEKKRIRDDIVHSSHIEKGTSGWKFLAKNSLDILKESAANSAFQLGMEGLGKLNKRSAIKGAEVKRYKKQNILPESNVRKLKIIKNAKGVNLSEIPKKILKPKEQIAKLALDRAKTFNNSPKGKIRLDGNKVTDTLNRYYKRHFNKEPFGYDYKRGKIITDHSVIKDSNVFSAADKTVDKLYSAMEGSPDKWDTQHINTVLKRYVKKAGYDTSGDVDFLDKNGNIDFDYAENIIKQPHINKTLAKFREYYDRGDVVGIPKKKPKLKLSESKIAEAIDNIDYNNIDKDVYELNRKLKDQYRRNGIEYDGDIIKYDNGEVKLINKHPNKIINEKLKKINKKLEEHKFNKKASEEETSNEYGDKDINDENETTVKEEPKKEPKDEYDEEIIDDEFEPTETKESKVNESSSEDINPQDTKIIGEPIDSYFKKGFNSKTYKERRRVFEKLISKNVLPVVHSDGTIDYVRIEDAFKPDIKKSFYKKHIDVLKPSATTTTKVRTVSVGKNKLREIKDSTTIEPKEYKGLDDISNRAYTIDNIDKGTYRVVKVGDKQFVLDSEDINPKYKYELNNNGTKLYVYDSDGNIVNKFHGRINGKFEFKGAKTEPVEGKTQNQKEQSNTKLDVKPISNEEHPIESESEFFPPDYIDPIKYKIKGKKGTYRYIKADGKTFLIEEKYVDRDMGYIVSDNGKLSVVGNDGSEIYKGGIEYEKPPKVFGENQKKQSNIRRRIYSENKGTKSKPKVKVNNKGKKVLSDNGYMKLDVDDTGNVIDRNTGAVFNIRPKPGWNESSKGIKYIALDKKAPNKSNRNIVIVTVSGKNVSPKVEKLGTVRKSLAGYIINPKTGEAEGIVDMVGDKFVTKKEYSDMLHKAFDMKPNKQKTIGISIGAAKFAEDGDEPTGLVSMFAKNAGLPYTTKSYIEEGIVPKTQSGLIIAKAAKKNAEINELIKIRELVKAYKKLRKKPKLFSEYLRNKSGEKTLAEMSGKELMNISGDAEYHAKNSKLIKLAREFKDKHTKMLAYSGHSISSLTQLENKINRLISEYKALEGTHFARTNQKVKFPKINNLDSTEVKTTLEDTLAKLRDVTKTVTKAADGKEIDKKFLKTSAELVLNEAIENGTIDDYRISIDKGHDGKNPYGVLRVSIDNKNYMVNPEKFKYTGKAGVDRTYTQNYTEKKVKDVENERVTRAGKEYAKYADSKQENYDEPKRGYNIDKNVDVEEAGVAIKPYKKPFIPDSKTSFLSRHALSKGRYTEANTPIDIAPDRIGIAIPMTASEYNAIRKGGRPTLKNLSDKDVRIKKILENTQLEVPNKALKSIVDDVNGIRSVGVDGKLNTLLDRIVAEANLESHDGFFTRKMSGMYKPQQNAVNNIKVEELERMFPLQARIVVKEFAKQALNNDVYHKGTMDEVLLRKFAQMKNPSDTSLKLARHLLFSDMEKAKMPDSSYKYIRAQKIKKLDKIRKPVDILEGYEDKYIKKYKENTPEHKKITYDELERVARPAGMYKDFEEFMKTKKIPQSGNIPKLIRRALYNKNLLHTAEMSKISPVRVGTKRTVFEPNKRGVISEKASPVSTGYVDRKLAKLKYKSPLLSDIVRKAVSYAQEKADYMRSKLESKPYDIKSKELAKRVIIGNKNAREKKAFANVRKMTAHEENAIRKVLKWLQSKYSDADIMSDGFSDRVEVGVPSPETAKERINKILLKKDVKDAVDMLITDNVIKKYTAPKEIKDDKFIRRIFGKKPNRQELSKKITQIEKEVMDVINNSDLLLELDKYDLREIAKTKEENYPDVFSEIRRKYERKGKISTARTLDKLIPLLTLLFIFKTNEQESALR